MCSYNKATGATRRPCWLMFPPGCAFLLMWPKIPTLTAMPRNNERPLVRRLPLTAKHFDHIAMHDSFLRTLICCTARTQSRVQSAHQLIARLTKSPQTSARPPLQHLEPKASLARVRALRSASPALSVTLCAKLAQAVGNSTQIHRPEVGQDVVCRGVGKVLRQVLHQPSAASA